MPEDTSILGGNGTVTTDIDFVDTGPVRRSLVESMAGENPSVTAHEIAKALWDLSPSGDGSGGGGIPSDTHVKQIKKHNWATVILAVVSALGVAIGSYYATEARSKHNERQIIKHDSAIEQNTDDVRYIKVRVKSIDDTLTEAKKKQSVILDGIEELKSENVNRLKEELRDARRELRRRPRRAP